MLTAEENEILTRVGPQTPMGRMMRRFWLPICTSAQLPEADGDPLRMSLLGEPFVVFRDTDGQVGVLEELCMHRGVSLALGRVEQGGIRCLYHGWKFGADGTILDTPNHCNARFRERMKAPAFLVREAGGLVWAYIGPKGRQPEFPHYAFMDGPSEHRAVIRLNTPVNYLQLFEGGVDSSHVGILHSNQANPTWMNDEFTAREDEDFNPGALASGDNAPTLDIEDTAFGFHYVAKRQGPPAADGRPATSIRVTPAILPVTRIIPAPAFQFFVFEVPQSDTVTSTYIIAHGPKPIDRAEIIRIMGLKEPFWNDEDCDFRADWANRLGQDRSRMKDNWTGFDGIEQEDAVLAMSMGPILDRTREHMVAADRAVIHLRARLLESVRRHEEGEAPVAHGLDLADVRSLPDTVIAQDDRWQDLVPGNVRTGRTAMTDKARP
ncbi:Rieske 2Fe-2S domain-containing protein [Streptomyces sp. NBC_01455]|uniref:Rieske 2Fe-2S domain-containing protein n=1 Tax=Streptomyces sp. NBC_01455 TaxID=2903874 RepID=UPI002E353B93|nr:Rieske 2Fe-2S domain-containing protein [Streptomyces sp. NBC_01455]